MDNSDLSTCYPMLSTEQECHLSIKSLLKHNNTRDASKTPAPYVTDAPRLIHTNCNPLLLWIRLSQQASVSTPKE